MSQDTSFVPSPAAAARTRPTLAQARHLMDTGNLDDADRLCREYMAGNNGDLSDALNLRAMIAKRRGDYTQAVALLHEALIQNPRYARGLYNLGRLMEETRQLPQAFELYRSALTHAPDHFPALERMGRVAMRLSRWEEALDVWRRVLTRHPGSIVHWQALA